MSMPLAMTFQLLDAFTQTDLGSSTKTSDLMHVQHMVVLLVQQMCLVAWMQQPATTTRMRQRMTALVHLQSTILIVTATACFLWTVTVLVAAQQ